MTQLTEEQIAALSPDPASLKAGKDLAAEKKWVSFAYNERVLWGEIKGSGSQPYRTQIDLIHTAFKCSCPSRKFPCKHGLGLFLLFVRSQSLFQETHIEPVWVKEWIDKRSTRVEKQAAEEKPSTPVEEEKKVKQKAKTQQKRYSEMASGVAELEIWLKDLLRGGFLSIPAKEAQFWQKTAARMIDAKVPGLGNMVKEFQEIDFYTGNSWQEEVLYQTSRIFLLLEGFKRIETLPPLIQEDVKSLIGVSRNQKELFDDPAAETVKDTWLVLGRQREVTDENLTIQRDWVYGMKSSRFALVLNFAFRNAPMTSLLMPGIATEAELVFYPGNYPLRAAVKMQGANKAKLDTPYFLENWEAVQDNHSTILGKFPWADSIPMFIGHVLPVRNASTWYLKDQLGYIMPLHTGFDIEKLYQILAISGGRAVHVAFLRQKDTIFPLGVWFDGKYTLV